MIEEYDRTLIPVKAKIDPANAGRDRSNTVEQREDRPRQKASVRLPAQDKRQYADWNRCR
jgi:hypothetical protein